MSLSIVVTGMIAADPRQGGATWAVLQYLLGLRALGHEVVFVEPVDRSKLRPESAPLDRSENYRYLLDALAEVGFDGARALVSSDVADRGEDSIAGLSRQALRERCERADLLLNVSGMLADEELIGSIPVRAYIDLDPAFVQLWHAQGIDMRFDAHTHFVTVGLEIGSERSTIPTDGRSWITTLQPVMLAQWPIAGDVRVDALTTVANWRGYGSIDWEGQTYGQKVHSIRELIEMPRRIGERFVLALAIHPSETRDLEALAANGWELVNPAVVACSPSTYRRFIQGSLGEIGIAKSGYVRSGSGWFSDRSTCYLASGRPVVAQDTGFSRHLPIGEGLFAFTTIDEVASAYAEIRSRYDLHRRRAREIAEEHFDARRVLSRLLERLGVSGA